MGYELYLRPADPATPLPDPQVIEAALREANVRGAEGAFTLPAGGAQVAVRWSRTEGVLRGLDVEVPFGAPDADFRAALLSAAQLGAKLSLVLLDPQLGGEVTPARAEAVVGAWRSANIYAVDTAGVVEDARSALPMPTSPKLVSGRTRLLLIGIGLLLVGYLIFEWLLSAVLQPGLKPID
jgi:hypothetical protein